MKKSINAWALPGGTELGRAFEMVAECGFEGIEINFVDEPDRRGVMPGAIGELSVWLDEKYLLKVREMAEARGLRITSASTGMFWASQMSNPDPAHRAHAVALAEQMIRCCAAVGGDTVLIVPGCVDDSTSYAEAYDNALQSMRKVRRTAEEYKINACVENVWNKFLLSPLEMRDFVDKVGGEYVGAYFDIGNVVVNSYPEYWIDILGGRIRKLHAKDFKRSVGNGNGFCNLLEGDVRWDRVMASLENIGYDGYIAPEYGANETDPYEPLRYNSAALDKIFGMK